MILVAKLFEKPMIVKSGRHGRIVDTIGVNIFYQNQYQVLVWKSTEESKNRNKKSIGVIEKRYLVHPNSQMNA